MTTVAGVAVPVSQFRNSETGPATARYETPSAPQGDHKKEVDMRDLELRHRDQIIGGLRDHGATYTDIRKTLGITARQVEAVLGEIGTLRSAGRNYRDIARQVGLARSTVQDIASGQRSPVLNARSNTTVAVLVDMYGMQTDVLGTLLDMDKTHVYKLIRDLRRDGLVMPRLIEVQPGAKWVVPTGETAASYLGWRPRTVWRPPLKDAEHYRAVAQARVMLVDASDPHAWISERHLRHEAEQIARESRSRAVRSVPMGGAHIHDARFLGVVDGTYGWWALEVELTAKSARNMDHAIAGAFRAARTAEPEPMTGVVYLCRGAAVERVVTAAHKRLPTELTGDDGPLFVVGDFDEEWQKFSARRELLRVGRKPAVRQSDNTVRLTRDAS